ncbi:MAG TPA: helix-turn-helix domain-containing protein [Bacteroidales bacterium]
MKLYIKNMVCNRCKATVESHLDKLGIIYFSVEIGEVSIGKKLSPEQYNRLRTELKRTGFELIDDNKNDLIENLKKAIVDLEKFSNEDLNTSYMDFISMRANDSFISLNTLFSEIEGITIEKYIIRQKIELVKELIEQNDFNMTEIAVKMHYSSVAQLSSQFKSITGLTPLHFKQLRRISFNNPAIN